MVKRITELLAKKNLKELKSLLAETNEQDLAECFDELSQGDLVVVFRLLDKTQAAEIFAYIDSDTQEKLVQALSDSEIAGIISKLYVDDMADLIEELPANLVNKVLKNTDATRRSLVNEILKYPEDSAGSIMTVEYVSQKENNTVADAFKEIRKTGLRKETIYVVYITDSNRQLVGVTSIRDLLLADPETVLKDIMEENVISIETTTDKEDVAKMFDKYDLLAIPVTDLEHRLVGIVTIDDAVDVMSEENEEDFAKMAAMAPPEDEYLKESVFVQYKNRIVWLLVLMLSAILTGNIITGYQEAFKNVPLLVSFIPMIMDTGGNCGSQASTMIIRGMATDEIKTSDILAAWWKEVRIALMVGLTLGLVQTVRIYFQYQNLYLGLTIGLTLVFTACLAKSLGVLLPMGAKALKLDPAYMASPLITTITDAGSLIIFFNIAMRLMNI